MDSTLRPSTESHSTTRPSSTQKQESYEYKTLSIVPSPLMTASLNSRHSATSAQESSYLARARYLRWSRQALTALIVATGVAAVACSGHVQNRYNSTHLSSEYHLALWPVDIDLRPNLVVLNVAAIAVLGSIAYLVFSLLPSVRPLLKTPHSIRLTMLPASFPQCSLQHVFRSRIYFWIGDVHLRPCFQRHPHQPFNQTPKGFIAILDLQVRAGSCII